MFIEERQSLIFSKLKRDGRAEVTEIAEELGVSVDTVRRDLKILEDKGLIIRTRGGAIFKSDQDDSVFQSSHHSDDSESNNNLAGKAASYIRHNESLFLDGSTSTLDIIPFISKMNIVIYTCSPFVASRLIEIDPEGRMELIGGRLCVTSDNAFGLETITRLGNLNPEKVVIGSCALSSDGRVSTISPDDASIRQILLNKGKEIIFLLDSQMWNKKLLCDLGELPGHCRIISDKDLNSDVEEKLKATLGFDISIDRV